jgi:diguanylate cyclase (GGDEF)-like protein
MQHVLETGQTVLSGLFIGPVTGKPTIAMGVPVARGAQIEYALSAGVSPARIAAMLQHQALPEEWVASVLDGTDTILARTRAAERFVGQKATLDLREQLRLQNEGVLLSYNKEGLPTYAAFSRSTMSDWSVVVAAPRAVIEAPLCRSIAWLVVGAVAAIAVGLTIALRLSARVSGSIRGLVAPALSLGSGRPVDRVPATGLAETEAVGQAIVEASSALRRTRHLAEHDALTGMPNRRLFDELAASRLAEARRHKGRLALLAIDLDGFKAVNDLHGHAAGDVVLKTAAERISSMLRESDVMARLGGDEFAVLLGEATPTDACYVADKLVDALSAPYAGVTPAVTASVGIASYPEAGQTVGALCEVADRALYQAKHAGRRRSAIDAP